MSPLLGTRRRGDVPFFLDSLSDGIRFNGDRRFETQFASPPDQFGPDTARRHWRQLASAYFTGLKTPVNLVAGLDPCRLANFHRQRGLPFLSHNGRAHSATFALRPTQSKTEHPDTFFNAIAPGYIVTDLTRPLSEDPLRGPAILERIPEGRWGTPQDLTGAALFLASRDADYLNGAILNVDGGWLGR
jgi:hypothetical protein